MIIVRLQGGMGNQMFQYALGRALSLKNDTTLKLDIGILNETKNSFIKREYNLDIYNISAEIATKNDIPSIHQNYRGDILIFKIYKYLERFIKSKGKEKYFQYDPSILNTGPDVYLDGYWQSPKYFIGFEDIIKKDFTFKCKLSDKIINLIEVIKKENSVCVHVRRGDYVGNKYHEIVGKDYYDKGIEYLNGKIKIDKIYVFSDDIGWCRENMAFQFPVMFVEDEYKGEKNEGHFALMKSCKYFIIPNSSFAWWSAWLSDYKNKIIICPTQWFADKSINSNDLIPKEWIKI